MKKNILFTLLIIFCINFVSEAQWVQTGGPEGANVSSMAISGTIFTLPHSLWIYLSTNNGSNWILKNNTFPTDTTKIVVSGSNILQVTLMVFIHQLMMVQTGLW